VIALLAALEKEASGLRRRMALAPERVAGFCDPAYTGRYGGHPVLLAWTGMGRERAEASTEAALTRYQATAVISIGFSGGLEGHLEVGDLVLASDLIGVKDPAGNEIEPTIYQANQGLLRAATEALEAASLRVVLGSTVTAPGIVATPADKQALGRRTGAIAVDMESYWVARVASDRGLGFLALRAISDAQADLLPPLHQIVDADGNPGARRLATYLIREPGSLVTLLRLAWNARQARRALTRGVACTVTAL
jgi:adenosylhomocysteine nucleosidase